MRVLVVGATGSIGHLAVEEAIRQGHTVRALVRDTKKAGRLPAGTDVVVGDLTRLETLAAAVDGVDAIVFTHGSDGGGKAGSERVDYGGVRNVLAALNGRSARVALMTAIGVTNREGDYNRRTEAHDWKRRGERLVTRERPALHDRATWMVRLQQAGRTSARPPPRRPTPCRRPQRRGCRAAADRRGTGREPDIRWGAAKELRTRRHPGEAQDDLDSEFARLDADPPGALDAVHDVANMPLEGEPQRVRADLQVVRKSAR